MTNIEDAAEAFAAVRLGREQVLAACECRPSRHFAFAALMAGYVALPGLPDPIRLAALVLLLCAMVLIVQWDRRRTGMFVNGYRSGQTRKVAFAMLAAILPLLVLNQWLVQSRGLVWPSLPLGLLAAAMAYAGSRWWMRVFRREMLAAV